MAAFTYRSVFSGEIREGLSPTKVRANVAARLSVGPQQIERIFSGKPVVLKNGVSEAAGIAYSGRLSKRGMIVSMEVIPGSRLPVATPAPIRSNAEAAWLSSPSFANLARAEALLNGSKYTNSIVTPPKERPWPPLEMEAPPA